MFISGPFLQIEERLNDLSKVTVGELRCLSCAQETELHPHLSLLYSSAAGWGGSALCSGSPRSISRHGENCIVQKSCPSPVPVLSTAEGALRPRCFGGHGVSKRIRKRLSLRCLSVWLGCHVWKRDFQQQAEKNTQFCWPADLNMWSTTC